MLRGTQCGIKALTAVQERRPPGKKKVDFSVISKLCVLFFFGSFFVSLCAFGKSFGRWTDVCRVLANITPEQWIDLKAGGGSGGKKKQTFCLERYAS